MFRRLALMLCVAAAACAQRPPEVPTSAQVAALPKAPGETATFRNAVIEPSGFLTILDAPPAPFTPAPPAPPPPPSADSGEFGRIARFQQQVFPTANALRRKLERSEKGNFVDLYYENEGEPHVVFRFLREPSRTLAKYTRDRRFRAAEAQFTSEQLRVALERMMTAFRDDRVIMGGGYGNKENRATLDIAVPEAEFRELAARKGVVIPPEVKLNFPVRQGAAALNRPLPADIARFVRIFQRDNRPVGAVNSINSRIKVVLRDGCFRSPDNGNALVVFPLGSSLFVDSEDYLAFGSEPTPGYGRVGEELIFGGSIAEVTAPELVTPLHAACGEGKVIKVNETRSAAADRAQYALVANEQALRQLRESYGLSESAARIALERCKAHSGTGTCLQSPPPPALREADCPAGTKLSFGLCRTPEGYSRPAPAWLADLIGT